MKPAVGLAEFIAKKKIGEIFWDCSYWDFSPHEELDGLYRIVEPRCTKVSIWRTKTEKWR